VGAFQDQDYSGVAKTADGIEPISKLKIIKYKTKTQNLCI
jgi:hypothetical protein